MSVPALARLRYRFQGREWSAATGLVNFRMRWYDSETGRWLSKDPIGLRGGINLFIAFGGDGINAIDPYGTVFMVCVNPEPEKWGSSAPDWHWKSRYEKNGNLPQRPPVDDGSWTELPLSQSIFHDNGKGLPERKFINSDGREAVYDGDTGALITDRQFMGTFNYVTPPTNGDSWWNWIWRGVGHGVTDVIPYIIWGN